MTTVDGAIVGFLNGFAGRSWTVDATMRLLVENSLLKGGLLLAALWSFWSSGRDPVRMRARQTVVATLVAALVGLVLARALALTLPFRYRPLHDPTVLFTLPAGMTRDYLRHWSSFPSDHATVLFGIATGLFALKRWVGIAAFVWVTAFVALPRVYLGLHYPTDIIGGAIMGIACVGVAIALRERWTPPLVAASESRPGRFYAAMFIASLLIATMFDSLRTINELGLQVARAILHRP
jgi:membrane-associated phospholipid phosphatase